jgi:hypothetical protein
MWISTKLYYALLCRNFDVAGVVSAPKVPENAARFRDDGKYGFRDDGK